MQYQEEIEILNTVAKQKPHLQLIAGIQRENRHLREIQAENKELRNALEDHQNALELIMSKYRQQTASLLRLSKTDFSSLHNSKYASVSKYNPHLDNKQNKIYNFLLKTFALMLEQLSVFTNRFAHQSNQILCRMSIAFTKLLTTVQKDNI